MCKHFDSINYAIFIDGNHFIASSLHLKVQRSKMVGFWRIAIVSVGKQNMTPAAKWTKINTDGTYHSGNGWLQNAKGSWSYDDQNNIFTAVDSLGLKDEFGGFTVSFANGKMYWKRQEKGMPVKITLEPIRKLPMAPVDYLVGLWELKEVIENYQHIPQDSVNTVQQRLFIRWDRIYMQFTKGKRLTGYWFMNGHKPELTLLPHLEDAKPKSWKININKTQLIMIGISEDNKGIQQTYIRRNSF